MCDVKLKNEILPRLAYTFPLRQRRSLCDSATVAIRVVHDIFKRLKFDFSLSTVATCWSGLRPSSQAQYEGTDIVQCRLYDQRAL
jgi:hypothetical protein